MALDPPPGSGTPSRLGKYELVKELSGSGVGSTWVAKAGEDATHLYSILRLHKHLTKNVEVAEAFLKEARHAQRLKHANAVAVVETGVADGEVFVVSEHVEGETLANLVRSAGTEGLPARIQLRIALDVLEALEAAHALDPEPLVHGELGPWSVLVGADGVSRIASFGVARALAKLGTHGVKNHDRLAYAAPERVKAMAAPGGGAAGPVDPRADLFSVGVILWEGISKQRLFSSKIEAAIIQKVLTAPIAALASLPGLEVAPDVDEAVSKALEREPARRVASANDFIMGLEGAGPDQIASAADVAAVVAKLAGKTLATRKAEVSAALAQPATGGGRGPAAPRARAATLLGVAVPGMLPSTPPLDAASGVTAPGGDAGAAAAQPRVTAPAPATASSSAAGAAVHAEASAAPVPKLGTPATAAAAKSQKPADKVDKPAEKIAMRPRAATLLGVAVPTIAIPEPPSPAPPAVDAGSPPRIESLPDIDLQIDVAEPAKTNGEPKKAPPAPVGRPGAPRGAPPRRADAPKPPLGAKPAPIGKPLATKPETKPADPKPADAKAVDAKPAANADPAKPVARADDKPEPVSHATGPTPGRGKAEAVDKIGPGSTLGRYEILMPVAKGGMAAVWAARSKGSRGFQKIVAVKTMLPDVSDDPDFETMFLDEARVAARIRHPNVVEILDLGEEEEVLYLVMEWVEGETVGTLQRASKALGGIPMPIVLRIASQVCAGLHAAHELRDDAGALVDLVHRDISPANVLVSTTGFVKIVDFGIAKSKGRLHVTRAGGTVKGKTPYLSPEQLGGLAVDRRSDLFSLGALLYVLSTGLHPFRGDTELKTVENIALKNPVPPSEINPSLSAEFEKVILKALEKDPTKRFATAAEMQRAIDQVASAGAPVTDEDVAAFVHSAIGDAASRRAAELKAAIASFDAAPAEPARPADAAAESAAKDAEAGEDIPVDDGSAEADDAQASADAPPAPPDVGAEPAAASASKSATDAADVEGDAPLAPEQERRKRTMKMVVVGLVAGLGILGAIGLLSSGGEKPQGEPKTQATSTERTTVLATAPAPTAEPAPPPTAEPAPPPTAEVAPPPTAEPTATAAATVPTPEPPPAATPPTPPPKATAKAPPTPPSKPPAKPPSKPPAKPPSKPPKYNPKGI